MNKEVAIKTRDGLAPAQVFHPAGAGPWRAVVFYMDAIGIRPALGDMCRRIADSGYFVLLPDLYYRLGPWSPITPAEGFREGPERQRMLQAMGHLTNAGVAADTAHFLDFLVDQPEVIPSSMACIGYCMGAAHALTAAATQPTRVNAVAVFHGARLVTDQDDSPHLSCNRIKARIHVGVAGIDPWLQPGEMDELQRALNAAKVDHVMETYEGVSHGFAVNDQPAWNSAAAERHWQAVLNLLQQT